MYYLAGRKYSFLQAIFAKVALAFGIFCPAMFPCCRIVKGPGKVLAHDVKVLFKCYEMVMVPSPVMRYLLSPIDWMAPLVVSTSVIWTREMPLYIITFTVIVWPTEISFSYIVPNSEPASITIEPRSVLAYSALVLITVTSAVLKSLDPPPPPETLTSATA